MHRERPTEKLVTLDFNAADELRGAVLTELNKGQRFAVILLEMTWPNTNKIWHT